MALDFTSQAKPVGLDFSDQAHPVAPDFSSQATEPSLSDVFSEGAAQSAAQPSPLLPQLTGIGQGVAGAGEAGASLLSGMLAPIPAGLAGLGAAATNAVGLTNTPPADVVGNVSNALTYQPRSEIGQQLAGAANYPFEKLAQGGRYLGEKVQEGGGNPIDAATAETLVNALPFLLGAFHAPEGVAKPEAPIAEVPAVAAPALVTDPVASAVKATTDALTGQAPDVPPPAAPLQPETVEAVKEAAAPPVEPSPPPEVLQQVSPSAQTGPGAATPIPENVPRETAVAEASPDPIQELRDHGAQLATADHPEALALAQAVDRAYDAGIDPHDIADATFEGNPADSVSNLGALLEDKANADTGTNPLSREGDTIPPAERPGATDTAPEALPAETVASDAKDTTGAADTGRASEPDTTPAAVEEPIRATKADTDAQREARGVDVLPDDAPHGFKAADAEAKDRIAQDPTYPAKLANEVLESKRPIDDTESMALLNDRVRLQSEYSTATDAIQAARESGNTGAELKATLQREQLEHALNTNERAARYSKSAVARSLNATKAGLTQDYSLAHNITRAKIDYGDKFGEGARKQIADLSDQLKAREDELTALKAKQKPPKETVKKSIDEQMQDRVRKQIEKLEGQIKQRLSACPI